MRERWRGVERDTTTHLIKIQVFTHASRVTKFMHSCHGVNLSLLYLFGVYIYIYIYIYIHGDDICTEK